VNEPRGAVSIDEMLYSDGGLDRSHLDMLKPSLPSFFSNISLRQRHHPRKKNIESTRPGNIIVADQEEAKVLVEAWRRVYNRARPHSSLGYRPPAPEAHVVGKFTLGPVQS
jgi:hypothetical protein